MANKKFHAIEESPFVFVLEDTSVFDPRCHDGHVEVGQSRNNPNPNLYPNPRKSIGLRLYLEKEGQAGRQMLDSVPL